HWPEEVRLAADKRALTVRFEDGAVFTLPAEYLRVMSPSAEVQGHTPEQKKTVAGKRNVMIIGVEPVGHYAVRLTFDDLHDTGIYGWDLLHELGRDHAARFAAYEAELAAKGLSRDPPARRG
ncbi:MAG: gamma-butyrobetaine hydroxylase-like domain-containing protein, partial [Beijerinckiaceae bacterium]